LIPRVSTDTWQMFPTPDHSAVAHTDEMPGDETASVQQDTGQVKSNHSSSITSSLKVGKDAYSVRQIMEDHWLYRDHAAYAQHPDFEATVKGIIFNPRHSIMNKEQLDEFFQTKHYVGQLNEATFIHNILPLIIKRTYTKMLKGDEVKTYLAELKRDDLEEYLKQSIEEELRGYLLKEQGWLTDGVLCKMDANFRPTMLPNRFQGQGHQAAIAAALAKDNGITDPRPDICYGIKPDTYKDPDVIFSQAIQALLGITPGMHHPFLIIEGKSEEGSMAEAQNQACRGGAVLVNAARLLRAHIKEPDIEGVDKRTFVFSAAMSPGLMQIYVHFAEVMPNAKGVRFHMNRVASRALDESEQVVQLCAIVHNILEWGCNTRRPMLTTLLDKLTTFQRGQTAKDIQEANEKSNKKRKASGAAKHG